MTQYLTPALDLALPLEYKLFKTLEQILQANEQFEATLSTVELETAYGTAMGCFFYCVTSVVIVSMDCL